ncbi:MAG: transposase [Desulfarculus sp.]|nr:transposase [Desulfarculus sp.]
MGDRRRSFSREFKLEAVRLMTEGGLSVAQAARDLGIRESVLAGGGSSWPKTPWRPSPAKGT